MWSRPVRPSGPTSGNPGIGLFDPSNPDGNVAWWRINGHRAVIIVWTPEEWERLAERPADAQCYPSGVWCALRVV